MPQCFDPRCACNRKPEPPPTPSKKGPGLLTDAFKDILRKTLELHFLIFEGKGDSPEADQVREDMDAPYYALTQEDQKVSGEFSAMIYKILETD